MTATFGECAPRQPPRCPRSGRGRRPPPTRFRMPSGLDEGERRRTQMKTRAIEVLTLSLLAGATFASSAAAAPAPISQRTIDPATGLAITMTTSAPGTASFEVASGRLIVRKDVLLGRSITTITSGEDRVSLVIDAQGI